MLNEDALVAYEEHMGGTPMRELARQKNVQASTIMRQVRKVEDAMDDGPFEAYMNARKTGEGLPDDTSLSALIDMARRPELEMIVAADMSAAGVVDTKTQNVLRAVPVVSVGALVGQGLIKRVGGEGKLRRYQSVGKAKEVVPQKAAHDEEEPHPRGRHQTAYDKKNEVVFMLQRRKWLNGAEVRIASDLIIEWESFRAGNPTATVDDFEKSDNPTAKAFAKLQPGLRDVIEGIVIEDGWGLEAFEKEIGWPARSAKVMLKYALQALIQNQ